MIRTPSLRVNSFLQKNLSRSGYQSPFTRDACTKMSALALSCAAERCYLKGLHPGFLRRKVARSETAITEQPRGARRLARAEIRRPQYRAHCPLGCDRIPPDELGIAREHAAEILRPWPV